MDKFLKPKPKNDDSVGEKVPLVHVESVGVLSDSDSDSLYSMASVASVSSSRLRKRPRTGDDSGSDSAPSEVTVPANRSGAKPVKRRGRPVTTGKYVGIGQARREAAAAEKAAVAAEKQMEDERQIAALTKKVSEARVTRLMESASTASELITGVEDLPASNLNQKMVDAVAAIKRVGSISKGLNGVCKKALKEAAASILESAEVLLSRTTTEETALLRMQNAKLAAQMDQLRKEHEELKAEMVSFRREHLRREVNKGMEIP
ncbi:hypothetical protein B5X24_HaOG212993 [Helicoverpa armigera]|nr:hypothetical protein B5X24_HaOG212993 [Helicoverpa armigera]